MRAGGTHPTHESRNRRPTVGCVAQATHAFGGEMVYAPMPSEKEKAV